MGTTEKEFVFERVGKNRACIKHGEAEYLYDNFVKMIPKAEKGYLFRRANENFVNGESFLDVSLNSKAWKFLKRDANAKLK